jgi:dTMP kinase
MAPGIAPALPTRRQAGSAPTGTATLGGVTRPASPPTRGWFITIEGPEGAGKTTQAARLEVWLRDAAIPVVRTREPGGTKLGEQLRDLLLAHSTSTPIDPLADALLFNAARRQLVAEVIRPAVDAGTSVVCARFADSTLAYQGYGAGLDLGTLRSLEAIATNGMRPDLTILLDLPVEIGLARKTEAVDQTRFETGFDVAFHRRVRDGFRSLAAAEPARFAVVDATAPVSAAWSAVRAAVAALVGVSAGPNEPQRPVVRIQG